MKNLEPHQYRLLNERAELRDRLEKLMAFVNCEAFPCVPPAERDRLEKLMAFVNCEAFPCVPPAERDRLHRQVDHMSEYLNVLNERVEAIEA